MSDPEVPAPNRPDSDPEATQRLTVGAPSDPFSTQRLNLSASPTADPAADPTTKATVKLKFGEPGETQKLVLPLAGDPPIRVQKTDEPARAEGQTQMRPANTAGARQPIRWKMPLAVACLAGLGILGYLWLVRGPAPIPPAAMHEVAPAEPIPAGAQVYLEQAKTGDAHAMRMLGVMYYYGLNVPQDREKGLYWYRKAAEKGSDAARAELARLEAVK